MPLDEFIILVYVCIAENFKKVAPNALRKRGFPPALSDEEVLTIEIVGEFLGFDKDKQIWEYFKNHWLEYFPALGSREQFCKQAANLWRIKQLLQEKLVGDMGGFSDIIHMVDGVPIPICHYARSRRAKSFKGEASYGYCASKDEKYYGFSGHVMINSEGCIAGFNFTASNVSERDAMLELLGNIKGLLIGDKGYISAELKEKLAEYGIDLQTPLRKNMDEKRPKALVKWLISTRRLVETVIGQLTERLSINKVRARNMWRQTNRIARKILAHTIGIFAAKYLGINPLQFDKIINVEK